MLLSNTFIGGATCLMVLRAQFPKHLGSSSYALDSKNQYGECYHLVSRLDRTLTKLGIISVTIG